VNYTVIDVIVDAINDIRVGNAYASADLVIMNPWDWTLTKRIKTR
jgi:hypothetical protein